MPDDPPEVLQDSDGRWIRRDVFIEEMLGDNPEAEESSVNDALDDMIADGPMREKEMGEHEYIQLKSRVEGMKSIAKLRAKMARERATDIVRYRL